MKNILAVGIFSWMLLPVSGCSHEEADFLAGGREVEAWITALQNPDPQVRRQAVMKLGNVGDADPAAMEGLAEALCDKDAQVRRAAIFAVVKLEKPTASISSQLNLMSRGDSEQGVREVAARALEMLNRID